MRGIALIHNALRGGHLWERLRLYKMPSSEGCFCRRQKRVGLGLALHQKPPKNTPKGFQTFGIGKSKCTEAFQTFGIGKCKCTEGFQTFGIGKSKCTEAFQTFGIGKSKCTEAFQTFGIGKYAYFDIVC